MSTVPSGTIVGAQFSDEQLVSLPCLVNVVIVSFNSKEFHAESSNTRTVINMSKSLT